MIRIAVSSAFAGIALCLNGCAGFANEKSVTVSDAFRASLYERFPEPLTEPEIDAFNVFYCLNAPDWLAPSETCDLVQASAEQMRDARE